MLDRCAYAGSLVAAVVMAGAMATAATAGEDITSLDTGVTSVTIHPDGTARVERQGRAELTAGAHRRRVALPAAVRADSVTAAVAGAARIQAVRTTRRPAAESPAPRIREIRAELESVRAERAGVADELAAIEDELAYIRALAKLPEKAPEAFTERLADEGIIPRLQGVLAEQGPGVRSRRRDAQERLDGLDGRIGRLEKQLEQLRDRGEPRRAAVVTLRAEEPGEVRVRLRYRVDEAHWQPVYVARLDTAEPKLTLERRARVRQATGEDWDDVDLAMSTAMPVTGQAPTGLETWWIDLGRPPAARAEAKRKDARAQMAGAAQEASGKQAPGQTSVEAGRYAATYRVSGPVSVAADNQPTTFDVATHELKPELVARVTPQRSERAWLTAVAGLGVDEVLPAGRLQRFRDGRYLGEGRLESWPPGTERELAFGTDPALEVRYTAMADEAGETGWISRENRRTRRYQLKLTNRHDFALPVSLRYRMPVPRNEDITVEPLGDTPEPDESDVDGRRGVLGWRFELAPDETRKMPLGFDVRFPEGAELQGL